MLLVEHGDLETSTFDAAVLELVVSALDGTEGLSGVELIVCSQSLARQVLVGLVAAAAVAASFVGLGVGVGV